jgi:four helix bundle protein
MRNFREYVIWNEGVDLTIEVYKLTQLLPKDEEYGLKSQLKRAAVSIPSNIAEGCSRSSEKDFRRFLEFSLGSAFEVETDIVVAQKLKMISESQHTPLLDGMHSLQRQISSLISKLDN